MENGGCLGSVPIAAGLTVSDLNPRPERAVGAAEIVSLPCPPCDGTNLDALVTVQVIRLGGALAGGGEVRGEEPVLVRARQRGRARDAAGDHRGAAPPAAPGVRLLLLRLRPQHQAALRGGRPRGQSGLPVRFHQAGAPALERSWSARPGAQSQRRLASSAPEAPPFSVLLGRAACHLRLVAARLDLPGFTVASTIRF